MTSINPELILFSNGLKLIFQPNNFSPVITAQAWINAGSADEKNEEHGIAHVLEHMLFKGTPKYPSEEIAQLIEANGGEINAFTSFDQTVYHMTIASKYINLAIDILYQMVTSPLIDEKSLASEKEVILEEIKRSTDAPGRELSNLLFASAFKGHPYGKPIIGTVNSVKSHSRSRIINFFKKWYSPRNIVFIIIGDSEKSKVVNLIEKTFKCKQISAQHKRLLNLKNSKRTSGINQKAPRFEVKYSNVNEALIDMAFPIPDINHPDTAIIDVLSAILGQGDTSFLYNDIKFQKQLVNDISTYSYNPKDRGILLVSISLNPEKFEAALKEIVKKLVEFKWQVPDEKEMQKAKTNILSDHIFQRETVDGQARKVGLYYTMSG